MDMEKLVTYIFGTQNDSSPEHETTLLLQGDDDVLQEKWKKKKIKSYNRIMKYFKKK